MRPQADHEFSDVPHPQRLGTRPLGAGRRELRGATARNGDFCLIQSNALHSLRGLTETITPYVHFDIFYNSRREEGFRPGAGTSVPRRIRT